MGLHFHQSYAFFGFKHKVHEVFHKAHEAILCSLLTLRPEPDPSDSELAKQFFTLFVVNKKSPAKQRGSPILKRNPEDYFPPFSILAFNSARISLLSPKVDAEALLLLDEELVFSVAVFTFFSSSSRKIAV
jgi:hypothetical protein